MNYSKADNISSGPEHSSETVTVVSKESATSSETTPTVAEHSEPTERTFVG